MSELKIIPLGGLGEIGLNMMVFEYEEDLLVVDAGLMFPEDAMLGVDCVIPDMTYLRERRDRVAGIVLTHAHEDHIGALPYLLRDVNAPVYGTAFTLGMAASKLDEHGLRTSARLTTVHPRQRLPIGAFGLEFMRVAHSVVDGVGLAVQTPLGVVVHTGDFKLSPSVNPGLQTDVNRFAHYGEAGVLALLSDSTNVEQEGRTISTRQISDTLDRIAAGCTGRIIVALFASNIERIQQIVDIARARGRKVAVSGRSIETSVAIARELGYLDLPADILVGIHKLGRLPDDRVLLITTGSQGEPMSVLARMATGHHRQITIHPGDTVVLSSKFIPGNEKAIAKIINALYRLGADVIYEKISAIHVSGHAFRDELKLMIRLTRPRYFVPIHGEYRHLVLHARLARSEGVPPANVLLAEDGQVIRFDAAGGRLAGEAATGRVLVDGKGIGDVGQIVLRERRILSKDGMVVVNMAFDEESGYIIYGPELASRGFVFETETGHVLEDAKCVILEIVDEIGPDVPDRVERIRSRVQSDLRKYFDYALRRRPVIVPFVVEL